MCAEDSWDASSSSPCPKDLQDIWGRPQRFFSLLRNPRADPTPVMWESVRERWPILQGVPDDELLKNLVECRKEIFDARFVDS